MSPTTVTQERMRQVIDRSVEFEEPICSSSMLKATAIGLSALAVPFIVGFLIASTTGFVATDRGVQSMSAFYIITLSLAGSALIFLGARHHSTNTVLMWTAAIGAILGTLFPSALSL